MQKARRPPHISPELWQMASVKQRDLMAQTYKASLEIAEQSATAEDEEATKPDKVCPIMPRQTQDRSANSDETDFTQFLANEHRKFTDQFPAAGFACVARPVKPAEVKVNAKAQAAMDKEWKALWDLGTWDHTRVCEWSQVRRKAQEAGERVHIGMVFGICVEKNAELPEDHPARKYKGRVVFGGNQVRDEENLLATFQDLGSAPVGIEDAGPHLDAAGLLRRAC